MIRIIIAEDQRMLRGALGALLDLEDDIEVVGQAANGEEALKLIESLRPDISIMDIEMPIQSGLDVAGEKEVLVLAKEGKTTNEIAKMLYLSPGTVRNYISEVLAKLEAKNRIEAITIAEEKGWI
jgi:DNA-binding NarL/FixJ family response regulator